MGIFKEAAKSYAKEAKLARSLAAELTGTLEGATRSLESNTAAGGIARGKVFQAAGYLEEAAESYSQAMEAKASDEAAARLAIVLLYAGNAEKALATATELARRNPSFEVRELTSKQRTSALTILGDAQAQSGRLDEAIETYKRARKTSPKDTFAAGRLAQAYLAKGDTRKAAEFVEDAARNPRFASVSRQLSGGVGGSVIIDRRQLVAVHGRPLFVEEKPRLAPIVRGDSQWCEMPEEP